MRAVWCRPMTLRLDLGLRIYEFVFVIVEWMIHSPDPILDFGFLMRMLGRSSYVRTDGRGNDLVDCSCMVRNWTYSN